LLAQVLLLAIGELLNRFYMFVYCSYLRIDRELPVFYFPVVFYSTVSLLVLTGCFFAVVLFGVCGSCLTVLLVDCFIDRFYYRWFVFFVADLLNRRLTAVICSRFLLVTVIIQRGSCYCVFMKC
jgi:hypothetical protein